MARYVYHLLVIAALGSCCRVASADLVVPEWELSVGVSPSSGGQNVASFTQVQNGFVGSHSATVPPSSVGASYGASWAGDAFMFSLSTIQHAENLPGLVATAGHINVTPMVDSLLSIDASYIYNMPIQPAQAQLAVSVSRSNPFQVLYSNTQTRTNFTGPPSGTILVDSDVFLPAGQTWRLQ